MKTLNKYLQESHKFLVKQHTTSSNINAAVQWMKDNGIPSYQ